MILLIDNYDSFVHNLVRYISRLGQDVRVIRNDAPQLGTALPDGCSGIVISPGPCAPSSAGRCLDLVREQSGKIPILGVCLGHQAICEAFGGTIVRAAAPVHGRCTPILLESCELFAGLPPVTQFARYHSLVAEAATLPDELRVLATSLDTGEIMAVQHTRHPTYGVQFHPESVLSEAGYQVLSNFLRLAGCEVPQTLPANDWSEPLTRPSASDRQLTGEASHTAVLPARADQSGVAG